MFEHAASFPREAEESLAAAKQKYKSLLGLIGSHAIEAKPLIAQMGIKSEPVGQGYEYSITIPDELAALAKSKAIALLSRFDPVDLDWFEYLASTEFYPTFDQENEKAYAFPPDITPDPRLTPSASLREGGVKEFSMYGKLAKAFDCYLRVKRFL